MANRPVPVLVDVQPLEQGLVALEQVLAGVEEQALAEAPRPRQEVVGALVHQPPDVRGLVDVVAVFLANPAEGLDAYGESASGHGCQLVPALQALSTSKAARLRASLLNSTATR